MQDQFYLETYGCSLNMADSDLIVGRLHKLGLKYVERQSEADVIILNSCGVKEPTEDRIISRLEELSRQSIPVVITGCLPRISLERILTAIPNHAAILGPQSLVSLGPVIEQVLDGKRGLQNLESDSGSKLRFYESPSSTVICTIPICEGCIGNCAYCAVKFARSSVISYSIEEIVDVAKRSVHNGFKEIRLTAQDIGAFGHDSRESLVELLNRLSVIPGDYRYRLGMINPNLVLDRLERFLDVMDSSHFFQFFHIPLQSGSDRVLRRMNRKYTVAEWKYVVQEIIDRFPRATIATDIIVGFPGENKDDFEDTMTLLRETRPSVINVSKYGDRPGTAASKATDKVHTGTKKERSRHLSKLVNKIVTESNESWIGWSGEVIVTGTARKNQMQGRNPFYKSIIINDRVEIGTIVNIKIIDGKKTHLVGTIL
jgi:MiaB-like tRNA modifying enzyme